MTADRGLPLQVSAHGQGRRASADPALTGHPSTETTVGGCPSTAALPMQSQGQLRAALMALLDQKDAAIQTLPSPEGDPLLDRLDAAAKMIANLKPHERNDLADLKADEKADRLGLAPDDLRRAELLNLAAIAVLAVGDEVEGVASDIARRGRERVEPIRMICLDVLKPARVSVRQSRELED